MSYVYDTSGMRAVSKAVAEKVTVFKEHSAAVKTLVTTLSEYWQDPVNQRFSSQYLQNGAPLCADLEKIMSAYSEIMSQCANRYGTAIDNGNEFFNSF